MITRRFRTQCHVFAKRFECDVFAASCTHRKSNVNLLSLLEEAFKRATFNNVRDKTGPRNDDRGFSPKPLGEEDKIKKEASANRCPCRLSPPCLYRYLRLPRKRPRGAGEVQRLDVYPTITRRFSDHVETLLRRRVPSPGKLQ